MRKEGLALETKMVLRKRERAGERRTRIDLDRHSLFLFLSSLCGRWAVKQSTVVSVTCCYRGQKGGHRSPGIFMQSIVPQTKQVLSKY